MKRSARPAPASPRILTPSPRAINASSHVAIAFARTATASSRTLTASLDAVTACYRAVTGRERSLPLLLLLSLTTTLSAQPLITYSKYFKGSTPETVIITLNKNGEAVYKESVNDDQPLNFQLTEAETTEIFTLTDKLGLFDRPLESGLKVAQMGVKTFRFENGDVKNEVKFNYSIIPEAQAIQDWFERITESEQRYIDLDRAAHFDKLGVNQSLLLLQIVYEKNRLIAPQQFLPLLDRVIKNESYLHIARERAASLAEAFRTRQSAKVERQ